MIEDDPWEALRHAATAPVPEPERGAPGQRLLTPRRPARPDPAPARPARSPRRRRRARRVAGRGRRGLLAAGAVVLVAVVAAVGASWSGASRATAPPPDVPAERLDNAIGAPTAPPTDPCPVSAAALAADVDGDGCPEDLRVEYGVLITPIGRYAVGEAGDVVLVGDWDCDGVATPAAFRPGTGSVFLFPTWADAGELRVQPTATVTGATTAEAVDLDGDGCAEVVVQRADAEAAVVRPP
jgi:hypothetical protein